MNTQVMEKPENDTQPEQEEAAVQETVLTPEEKIGERLRYMPYHRETTCYIHSKGPLTDEQRAIVSKYAQNVDVSSHPVCRGKIRRDAADNLAQYEFITCIEATIYVDFAQGLS